MVPAGSGHDMVQYAFVICFDEGVARCDDELLASSQRQQNAPATCRALTQYPGHVELSLPAGLHSCHMLTKRTARAFNSAG